MAALTITLAHRRDLSALAHGIKPVVWIGAAGLSESVIHELDRALKSHELIKIRVTGDERETREAMLAEICEQLSAAPVRHIGRILVIYRPNPDKTIPDKTMPDEMANKTMNKMAMPRSRSTASGKENQSRRSKEDTPRSPRRRATGGYQKAN
ncbi:MAG: YhbY family RNA-binding protein [Betaproteobacteria bacterium]|nr:YhbY family RNA-binding protein [Betaproteobacteria bacterium]